MIINIFLKNRYFYKNKKEFNKKSRIMNNEDLTNLQYNVK